MTGRDVVGGVGPGLGAQDGPKRSEVGPRHVVDMHEVAHLVAVLEDLEVLPGEAADRPALGLAIKIADGDPLQRARPLVALSLLDELGLVEASLVHAVRKWVDTLVTDRKGEAVGELRFIGELDGRSQ